MSTLSVKLIENINNLINVYIDELSEKYNIDKKELADIWYGNKNDSVVEKKVVEKKVVEKKVEKKINYTDDDVGKLAKMKKEDLMMLCKEKNVNFKSKSTKQDLINLLIGEKGGETKNNDKKETKVEKRVEKKEDIPTVLKKLSNTTPTVAIRRNAFDNFEHPESKLVFDEKTKIVIGKQNDDGTVDELSPDDIDTCNKYKLEYNMPFNLDLKTKDEKMNKDIENILEKDKNKNDEDEEYTIEEVDEMEEEYEIEE